MTDIHGSVSEVVVQLAKQQSTIARLEATVESQQATIRLLREQLGAKSPTLGNQFELVSKALENIQRRLCALEGK